MSNIRFSQTINIKQFSKKLSEILREQTRALNLYGKTEEIEGSLEAEDYELSLLYLARFRQDLELFCLSVEDVEQNISSYLQASAAPQPTKPVVEQPQVVEKEAEIVTSQPIPVQEQQTTQVQNPFEQIQQIEKLVNAVRSLKGDAA